jgi:hypothetical protein
MSTQRPVEPAAALVKAREELATREAALASLQGDRWRLLISGTYAEVDKVDTAIAAEKRVITRCRDRIDALKAELKRQVVEKVGRDKLEALIELEGRMTTQVARASELEAAVKVLGDCLFAVLEGRAEILADWPACLPRPSFNDLRFTNVTKELAFALHGAGRPTWNRASSIPAPMRPIAVAGRGPQGIANSVRQAADAFLDSLRRAPVLLEQDDEAAA